MEIKMAELLPLISVIITVYNLECYVSRCIESVINQTYRNLEIIIINDGSIDSSLKMCNKYAIKDNRIRIISQDNQGISIARNKGIDISNGEYIMFVDGDDYLEVDAIEYLYNNVNIYKCDISICNVNYITPNESICYNNNDFGIFKNMPRILDGYDKDLKYIKHNVNLVCNKLFAKQLFNCIKFPYNRKIHEDVYTIWMLVHSAKRIIILPDSKYNYVQRAGSLSCPVGFNSKRFDGLDGYLERFICIESLYKNYDEEIEKISRKQLFSCLLSLAYEAYSYERFDKYLDEFRKFIFKIEELGITIYDCGLNKIQQILLEAILDKKFDSFKRILDCINQKNNI